MHVRKTAQMYTEYSYTYMTIAIMHIHVTYLYNIIAQKQSILHWRLPFKGLALLATNKIEPKVKPLCF